MSMPQHQLRATRHHNILKIINTSANRSGSLLWRTWMYAPKKAMIGKNTINRPAERPSLKVDHPRRFLFHKGMRSCFIPMPATSKRLSTLGKGRGERAERAESRERENGTGFPKALAKVCHGLWRTTESPTLCFCTPLHERERGEEQFYLLCGCHL